MATPKPVRLDLPPALLDAIPGNEIALLFFVGCYLGWGRGTLDDIAENEMEPQMWRDLQRAGKQMQEICRVLENEHERREARKRHEHANPELPFNVP